MLVRDSGFEISSWSRSCGSIGSRAFAPGKMVIRGWSETVISLKNTLTAKY